MRFTIEVSDEDYRILGPDGSEGPMVPLGSIATLKIDDDIYYCDLDEEDIPDDTEAQPEAVVYQIEAVNECHARYVDVEFPPTVVKAQRDLDAAIEGTSGVGIALVDTEDEPEPVSSTTEE